MRFFRMPIAPPIVGDIAQLVERLHGMQKVWGSTPHVSTIAKKAPAALWQLALSVWFVVSPMAGSSIADDLGCISYAGALAIGQVLHPPQVRLPILLPRYSGPSGGDLPGDYGCKKTKPTPLALSVFPAKKRPGGQNDDFQLDSVRKYRSLRQSARGVCGRKGTQRA